MGDGTRINEFFVKKSFEQYDFNNSFSKFNKAMLIIIHYFTDLNKRDLDNNSYKPLIDAIKKTGIIKDDTWQDLSLMVIGCLDSNGEMIERIESYLIPHQYLIEFLSSDVKLKNLITEHVEII